MVGLVMLAGTISRSGSGPARDSETVGSSIRKVMAVALLCLSRSRGSSFPNELYNILAGEGIREMPILVTTQAARASQFWDN